MDIDTMKVQRETSHFTNDGRILFSEGGALSTIPGRIK